MCTGNGYAHYVGTKCSNTDKHLACIFTEVKIQGSVSVVAALIHLQYHPSIAVKVFFVLFV